MDDTASAAFEAEMERQAQIVQGFFANAFASAFRDGLNGSVAQNALQFLKQQLTRIAAEAFGRGIEGALSGDFKRNLAGLLS